MNHGELIALDRKDNLINRLRKRTIRLTLAEPIRQLPDELRRLPARLDKEGYLVVIEPSPETDFDALLPRLFKLGLPIVDIETGQTRLEDVFMELTGLRTHSSGDLK